MAVIKSKKQRQSGKRKTLKRKSNKNQRGGAAAAASAPPYRYGFTSRRSGLTRGPHGINMTMFKKSQVGSVPVIVGSSESKATPRSSNWTSTITRKDLRKGSVFSPGNKYSNVSSHPKPPKPPKPPKY